MHALAAPGIDHEIYPMPMFVTFTVTDPAVSARWYEAAGFVVLATLPGPDGPDSVVHLRRLRYQDLLLVEGDPAPGVQVCLACGEDDLDVRADVLRRHLADNGVAGTVAGPRNTAWYTRDLVVTDPDGYQNAGQCSGLQAG
ncbi:VOC family protein, partial [Thermoactinospora rubra]|uniref:VOC family protein n=1 Tax=Thermoactinospora rubra TaxID=1088767 RepID=UPI000A0F6B74